MAILDGLKNKLTKTVFRAFDAGRSGRRLTSVPKTTVAINTLIKRYGKNVVARSRYLSENNPYTTQARNAYVAALAGDGIKPSSLMKDRPPEDREQLMELWYDWTDEADADGITDFYGLQSLVATELFEAGECFVRFRPRRQGDMSTVPLQVQLLPSEMLPYDDGNLVKKIGNNVVEMGIEYDAIGRRVAYHFHRQHPGAEVVRFDAQTTVRVPASEVLHIFNPIRAGQSRGVPATLSSMITLAMLDMYDDAELERKRTTALFSVFVTRPKGEDADHPLGGAGVHVQEDQQDVIGSNQINNEQFNLEPGAVIDLGLGEDVRFATPADVGNQYEAFEYRMLMRAASGMGVPYASMTGDLRRANYGSIRAGLVEFRRKIQAEQHKTMIFQFCRPIWQRWLGLAAINGDLPFSATEFEASRRDLSRVKWVPPRWDWVDPQKDLTAEKIAVENGFKSRSDVIEESGYDPEEMDARIAADKEREERLGIKIGAQPPAPAPAPGQEPVEDESEENDDGGEDEADEDAE